jgi:hypothetical protein
MSYRKITVDGQTYEYMIGKSNLKVQGFPAVDFSTLTGWTWGAIEKAQWKRSFSIKPAEVADFIRSAIKRREQMLDIMRSAVENTAKRPPGCRGPYVIPDEQLQMPWKEAEDVDNG